jgi:hypothetical protein
MKPVKKWQVETWLHRPSGVKLSVYYDPKKKRFYAPVGSETVWAETQEKARSAAHIRAGEILCKEEDWERKIFIEIPRQCKTSYAGIRTEDIHYSEEVGFRCCRAWIRRGPGGEMYTRDWVRDVWDVRRIEQQRDVKHWCSPFWNEEKGVELPYSDEVWEALMALSRALTEARDRLDEIVRGDDLIDKLLACNNGMKLLEG